MQPVFKPNTFNTGYVGTQGRVSGEQPLLREDGTKPFKRNTTDRFLVRCGDLGELKVREWARRF